MHDGEWRGRGTPSTDSISQLGRKIEEFGRLAAPLLDRYPLGLDPSSIRHELGRLRSILAGARREGTGLDASLAALDRLDSSAWRSGGPGENLEESVSHAAGALMTSAMWAEETDPEQLRRALVTKALYQHIAEILDDVIDVGDYSRRAAARLFRTTLQPLSQPRMEEERLRARLHREVVGPGSVLVDPLVDLTVQLHREMGRAPREAELRELFCLGNRFLSQGQSLSVLLQGPRVDVTTVRLVAERYYAPGPDLRWVERLGKYMSHVSNLALLDLSFVRPGVPLGDLNEHLRTWYYLDSVISIMDHLADLEADARAGIVNLALLEMRPEGPAKGRTPLDLYETLEEEDFDNVLRRLAELSARALEHAERSGTTSAGFYRVLTFLIPVVMLCSGQEGARRLLPRYLSKLSSRVHPPGRSSLAEAESSKGIRNLLSYQETRYSQQAAPVRTHEVFRTVPVPPLAERMPS